MTKPAPVGAQSEVLPGAGFVAENQCPVLEAGFCDAEIAGSADQRYFDSALRPKLGPQSSKRKSAVRAIAFVAPLRSTERRIDILTLDVLPTGYNPPTCRVEFLRHIGPAWIEILAPIL